MIRAALATLLTAALVNTILGTLITLKMSRLNE
ncbi:hypothetical protein P3T35_004169 [Kitasatospora sp. GP30]|nr:hypothetical protein [Kitasatospora sp. GP30]